MVKGLERLKAHFRNHHDAFVVIGGVACAEWLSSKGLRFRGTHDVDMVLILEALNEGFVKRFWEFVRAGHYENRQKSTTRREYYRFSRPQETDYPVMIELFSRRLESITLDAGQAVTPVPAGEDVSSLSAILMDDAYYQLLAATRTTVSDLPIIGPEGMIPLKARAWMDLSERKKQGERIDEDDIRKHRNDVFRLTLALGGPPFPLPETVRADLRRFVALFSPESPDWGAIHASLKNTGSPAVAPAQLIEVLVTHFGLS
ncbi:MAG: hypothetical protein HY360_06400 [Verrucomicrobia bacterium]|nr:hypothetical protein [Verrucomicrobiota bacterium]